MRKSCYRLWRLFTISFIVLGIHFVHLPGLQAATNHFFTTQATSEFMVVTNARSFNLTNEGSILLWFRADPVQPVISGAGLHAIVAKLESSSSYPFEIRFSDERASVPRRIQVYVWDGQNNPLLNTAANLDTNFHLLAFVKRDRTHLLFFDGQLVDFDTFDVGDTSNDHPIYIGRNGTGREFNGAVDDVQFWTKALSQTEIQHLMFSDPDFGDTNLFAYYDFNQSDGTDRSSNGRHGTVSGQFRPAPNPEITPQLAYSFKLRDFFPTTRYRLQITDSVEGTPPWMDATNGVRFGDQLFEFVGSATNRYFRLAAP
ncbi:MAG: LamG domain-containing protein [Limisphaerales bacterium]